MHIVFFFKEKTERKQQITFEAKGLLSNSMKL